MELKKILRTQIEKHGFVRFGVNDNLAKCTASVPSGYGAYVIHRDAEDGEVIYIGKAGTMDNDGKYKSVKLRHRLNANHLGIPRKEFFPAKMKEDNISTLYIEWFILKEGDVIPAYFEASLIQDFYEENHRLPAWNRSF